MNQLLQNDLEQLQNLLQQTIDEGLEYLTELNQLPTSVALQEPPQPFMEEGSGALKALAEFQKRYRKLMIASSGPRYWGFVTGGTTPAAIMGDILTTIYDQNTQTSTGHGDLSGQIELETINWLLELFELPKDFLGGFVTGATLSNFTCLGVARQWIGKQHGLDFARHGITKPIKILACVPHSSSIKALSMLGMGSNNIELIPSIDDTREAMNISLLKEKIQSLHEEPFILISSGGTVNTVDYDDFHEIMKLKDKHNFWWHIDAAFGAFAMLSKAHKHLLKGWENADSLTIDGHKWLNVPYESAFFFVKEKYRTLQIETYQNSNAPYLGEPKENFNFLNFLPENSRRLKALATWFTLKAYGKLAYQEVIERNISQAQTLGALIAECSQLELLAPVRLNTVCFTLTIDDSDKVTLFLNALNTTGKVFMTPTRFNNRNGIRAALVNWRTQATDVELVWSKMKEILDDLEN